MYNIKKRKLIFKNQVYKVYSNNIKSKRINIKDYLSIEVKGKTFGGVCCLIFKNNSIGLMKIYSPITKKFFYSIVQGFTEPNETAKDSIKREVQEEAGFKFKKKNFKKLCELYPIQSLIKSKLAVYKVDFNNQDKNFPKKIISEIGVGRLNFFKIKKIIQMIKKPQTFDLISYSALTYFLFLSS